VKIAEDKAKLAPPVDPLKAQGDAVERPNWPLVLRSRTTSPPTRRG
jgi:hypothetical protein